MRSYNWMRDIRPRRFRNSRMRRSGAELLELGLVLGLILLPIMFGTIEFGTYFYVEHNLQSAAREGARAACVYPDIPTQAAAANAAVQNLLSQSSLWNWGSFKNNLTINIGNTPDPNHAGQNYCTVSVSITWDKIPDGMRPMRMITNPSNTKLSGVAAMRVEQ
jgi:Flp pilus assembly protein TadG